MARVSGKSMIAERAGWIMFAAVIAASAKFL